MGEEASRLEPLQGPSLAWHQRMLESGMYMGLLAEVEGEVVGGAGILWQDMPPNPGTLLTTRAYILNVYVCPEARGQGIARGLLLRVLEECAVRGVSIISLHACKAGRPLYASLGFTATNEMKLIRR